MYICFLQEQPTQKISSLPPLKLPINMQSEQRPDNTENKLANGKDDDTDQINEKPQNNDAETDSPKDAEPDNSNLVNDSMKKYEDNLNHEESSETAPSETPKKTIEKPQPSDEDQAKEEGNEHDDKNGKSGENDKESEKVQGDDENAEETEERHTEAAETTTDETEHETSTNIIPPPKPPRLKPENAVGTNGEKESSKESDEEIGEKETGEETKESEERKDSAKSVVSKTVGENMTDAIENSIDNVEEDGHVEESEKAEMDGTQDDADVMQSPAPRTGW